MIRGALGLILIAIAACGDSGATIDATGSDTALPFDAAIDAPPGTILGTVGNVPGACASGSLAGTSCQILEVGCPSVAPARVEVRITAAIHSARMPSWCQLVAPMPRGIVSARPRHPRSAGSSRTRRSPPTARFLMAAERHVS